MDRSQRVRTYNFPENRISDHRVGYKAHNLDQVLDGDLDAVIRALVSADQAEKMAAADAAERWPDSAMRLLLDEIAAATARLAEAGVDSPRADAELIAAHVHGVGRGELQLVPDGDVRPAVLGRGRPPGGAGAAAAHHRARLFPLPGPRRSGPGVFVPRPETEVMTGWAIDELTDMDVAEPVVADLGTGVRRIALAIAQEVPRARVQAVEADPLARQWAQRNIARVRRTAPRTPAAG